MSAVFILGASITAYAGSIHQDYTGAKAVAASEQLYVQSTFDLIRSQNENSFFVEAYDVKESSVRLRWNGDRVYLGYNIFVYNPVTHQFDEYATTNKTDVVINNLQNDTSYDFMITSCVNDVMLGMVHVDTASLKPVLRVKDSSSDGVALKVSNTYDDSRVEIYRSEDGKKFRKIATVTDGKYFDRDVEQKEFYRYKAVMHFENGKTESDIVEANVPEKMGLPKVSGATKTYAYYTAVTAKGSPQYALLNSPECHTDEKTGIRMIGDYYCVALGSYYGSRIGTRYRITFSTGKSIKVILCDQKANRHTDSKHQYARRNCDVMEFYVEKSKIPDGVRGNYGNLEQFKGDIVGIERYSL